MNLITFLKTTDKIVSELSAEQRREFIHELARVLPENKRDSFLDTLYKIKDKSQSELKAVLKKRNVEKEAMPEFKQLRQELEQNQKALREINDGELYLDSEFNEEWDDWYNPNVDEILFSDPMQLLPIIEHSIELIHRCIDLEAYEEGCQLAETLSTLEITAVGDYQEYEGGVLEVHELYCEHPLLSGTFERMIRDCLFLAYMGNELQKRAEEIFLMISNFQAYSVRIVDILQNGKMELPETDKFLILWYDYLGQQSGMGVKKLLEEAQALIQDEDKILETARKYSKNHPELYLQILKQNLDTDKDGEMMQIGLEALKTIPETAGVRSAIALYTAKYACREQKEKVRDDCWMTAFESNPSIVNYMRLRFLSENWMQYKDKIDQVCNQVLKENKVSGAMLSFWNEKFSDVMNHEMNEEYPLGWSFTFMKSGIAGFLLLLFQGNELPVGLQEMLYRLQNSCYFTKEAFYHGTDSSSEISDEELFWNLLSEWKSKIHIPEQEKSHWLHRIEKLISFRMDGIMEANKRKYYGECASFIAALGEVCESMNGGETKASIMQKYKEKYPRRRAFIGELREYGLNC